jgi:hypothetical protein
MTFVERKWMQHICNIRAYFIDVLTGLLNERDCGVRRVCRKHFEKAAF